MLIALPIYLLSFFRIPKKVVHKIVSIQRNFLWGGDIEATKIPWVNWDTVYLPKTKGGLGIKDLTKFNKALLGKWGLGGEDSPSTTGEISTGAGVSIAVDTVKLEEWVFGMTMILVCIRISVKGNLVHKVIC